jgi:hypothetical protein
MTKIQQMLDAGLPIIANESNETTGSYSFSKSLSIEQNLLYVDINNPPTLSQIASRLRKVNARTNAKAIPSWVSWSEAEALAWLTTNIGTPLDTPIPTTITLSNIRPVLVNIVNVMKKQYALEQAQTRMLIALRDEIWSDLQDE